MMCVELNAMFVVAGLLYALLPGKHRKYRFASQAPKLIADISVADRCTEAGNYRRAIHWLELGACAKAGNYLMAERWLEEAQKVGLTPDLITYNSIIDGCAKAGGGAKGRSHARSHYLQLHH